MITLHNRFGQVMQQSATDKSITSIIKTMGIPGTSENLANVAAGVLGTSTSNLLRQTLYYSDGSRDREVYIFKKGPATQDDSNHGWSRVTDSDNKNIQQAASNIYNQSTTPKPVNPNVNKPTPTEKVTPITGISGYGGIQNITFIGGYDVSDDVISMNTEHVSSESEAVEPSTCKVLLTNHNQVYGHAIVSSAFTPGHTRIQSIVIITRNVVTGSSITQVTVPYIMFVGVVNEASYTNETATIECICESGFGGGSAKNRDWSADTFYSQKAHDIVEDRNEQTGTTTVIVDRTTSQGPAKSYYTASNLSSNEALRAVATQSSKDFYFSTDENLEPTLVLADQGTYNSDDDLEPFVVDPGDATALNGYANDVTVVPENLTGLYEKANVPDAVKNDIVTHQIDEDGIEKYGRIVAPIVTDPGIYSPEDSQSRADDLIKWYKTFIDRGIKVSVCSKIPLVRSNVSWLVPDTKSGQGTIRVRAGVNKKRVEYSANGVITQLECKLIEREPEPDTVTTEPDTVTTATEVVIKESPEYTVTDPVYDKETGNTYFSYRGRMNPDGTIDINATGITSEGYSVTSGFFSSQNTSYNVPSDVLNQILTYFTT